MEFDLKDFENLFYRLKKLVEFFKFIEKFKKKMIIKQQFFEKMEIVIEDIRISVTIFRIRYDHYTYDNDQYHLAISYDHFIEDKFKDVVSPSILKLMEMDSSFISLEKSLKLRLKYNLKIDDCLWMSDKGTFFAGVKKVKAGKLLREINPSLSDISLNNILEKVATPYYKFQKGVKLDSVNTVYNNPKLKIGSCMKNKDMSIYDKMGAQCLFYENKKGNITARVIVFPGKNHSRIYAANDFLKSLMKEYLKYNGYSRCKEGVRTCIIPGSPKDYFIPYMDDLEYCISENRGFYFSYGYNNDERKKILGCARNLNTDGTLQSI